jgi:hypothetical protein
VRVRKTIIFLSFFFLIFPKHIDAQLDCCKDHGGNYGCDFSTSKLYCADGTVSTICTCSKSTPTPTQKPTLKPTTTPTPSPTIPSCPNFSKYDTPSKSCKCVEGYVVNDNACVTNTEFCWIKYGGNAVFDKDKNNCICPSGYVWSDNTKCITLGQFCQDKLGGKSYYNSDSNSCNCYEGYAIQDNTCQLIPTQAAKAQQTSISIPTNTPTPTVIPSPKPTKEPTNALPTLALKDLGKDFSVEELIKPQENIFVKLLKGIWNLITWLI